LVVVTDLGNGTVRVDANAESATPDQAVDLGESVRVLRRYLRALDGRLIRTS
jgi:hypothetical protein